MYLLQVYFTRMKWNFTELKLNWNEILYSRLHAIINHIIISSGSRRFFHLFVQVQDAFLLFLQVQDTFLFIFPGSRHFVIYLFRFKTLFYLFLQVQDAVQCPRVEHLQDGSSARNGCDVQSPPPSRQHLAEFVLQLPRWRGPFGQRHDEEDRILVSGWNKLPYNI